MLYIFITVTESVAIIQGGFPFLQIKSIQTCFCASQLILNEKQPQIEESQLWKA